MVVGKSAPRRETSRQTDARHRWRKEAEDGVAVYHGGEAPARHCRARVTREEETVLRREGEGERGSEEPRL